MSIITLGDKTSYEGAGYINYGSSLNTGTVPARADTPSGFEYTPGGSGHVTWSQNQNPTWKLNSEAIGPNAEAEISQRTISEEPMVHSLTLVL